jgi:hypothetical protein
VLARLDFGQQALQRGPLQVAAGKAAVVVALGAERASRRNPGH